ncbi:hypothetical protein B0J12DRAFT_47723 [Macrophomina phaseolina]|uniref:Uncharacterized protein n=1 Tax=Macrophomina phaseolina TaxID=35725 RepID=A0ABQ8GGZ3_9PEZI|nr:hypothetical protein B0J12DRAFT_47723 [Macrophomina phaseolina]
MQPDTAIALLSSAAAVEPHLADSCPRVQKQNSEVPADTAPQPPRAPPRKPARVPVSHPPIFDGSKKKATLSSMPGIDVFPSSIAFRQPSHQHEPLVLSLRHPRVPDLPFSLLCTAATAGRAANSLRASSLRLFRAFSCVSPPATAPACAPRDQNIRAVGSWSRPCTNV